MYFHISPSSSLAARMGPSDYFWLKDYEGNGDQTLAATYLAAGERERTTRHVLTTGLLPAPCPPLPSSMKPTLWDMCSLNTSAAPWSICTYCSTSAQRVDILLGQGSEVSNQVSILGSILGAWWERNYSGFWRFYWGLNFVTNSCVTLSQPL